MKTSLFTLLLVTFISFSFVGLSMEKNHATVSSYSICFADTIENPKDSTQKPEIMPEFPGGLEKLYAFIGKNVVYPKEALKKNKEGKVLISFIIEKDGSVSNVKPLKPKSEWIGYGLEEEACRVVYLMPKWNPGTIEGKPVRVRFTLPVLFQLN